MIRSMVWNVSLGILLVSVFVLTGCSDDNNTPQAQTPPPNNNNSQPQNPAPQPTLGQDRTPSPLDDKLDGLNERERELAKAEYRRLSDKIAALNNGDQAQKNARIREVVLSDPYLEKCLIEEEKAEVLALIRREDNVARSAIVFVEAYKHYIQGIVETDGREECDVDECESAREFAIKAMRRSDPVLFLAVHRYTYKHFQDEFDSEDWTDEYGWNEAWEFSSRIAGSSNVYDTWALYRQALELSYIHSYGMRLSPYNALNFSWWIVSQPNPWTFWNNFYNQYYWYLQNQAPRWNFNFRVNVDLRWLAFRNAYTYVYGAAPLSVWNKGCFLY